jgi:hypothetical protein
MTKNSIIEITYDHRLVKGDIIELYAKTIANLGPLNKFFNKTFDLRTIPESGRGGTMGAHVCCYSSGLHAYIARKIMDADGNLVSSYMDRGFICYNNPSRKITLDKISDSELKVTLEGSDRTIKKLTKTLDEMFYLSPEEKAALRAVASYLAGTNPRDSGNYSLKD